MTQIKFVVTDAVEDLTWEEWNALEAGVGIKVREILSRYLVDENDKPVKPNEAMKILGQIRMKELSEVTGAFWKALREHSINPQIG